MPELTLITPSRAHIPGFVAALKTGWSPDNTQDIHAEQLTSIRRNVDAFLKDLTGAGGTIRHADGTVTPRLANRMFWMWDGEFCGIVGLRWQPGTVDLPPYVRGHIGYGVVPWKQRRGHASRALALVLPVARAAGLPRVFISARVDNIASRRVIERNGGVPLGPGTPPATGRIDADEAGYWIATPAAAAHEKSVT
jgi:predicted acetyltransferase